MSLTLLHRIFMYSITGLLLVVYLYTKDPNVWSVFTHTLAVIGSVELMSYSPAKTPQT